MQSVAVRASAEQRFAQFDIYGVGLRITSSCSEILDNFARDFGYFEATTGASPGAGINVECSLAKPPWERIPSDFAARITPNAVIYDRGSVRYNDYYHEALAIYDFSREEGQVWSENPDLLYEIVYLLCLSRVGEIHDLRRIHRVHALGVAIGGKGALVLLPEGGGKSTLCMELLSIPDVQILSDDTPLISGRKMLAFPTRVGLRNGSSYAIDPQYLRIMRRRNREPKTVLDIRYFRDRIVPEAIPQAVIVGARRNGDESWIDPIGAAKAMPTLAANMVFGLGLPQVVEFFLRGGGAEAASKMRIASYRLWAAARLAGSAKCYRLALGRDVSAAARAVTSVLRS